MKTQTWKINIPELVVRDVKVAFASSSEKMKSLGDDAKNDNDATATEMRKEVVGTSVKALQESFSCQRSKVRTQMRESYDRIASYERPMVAAYNEATKTGAAPIAAANKTGLDKLKSSKEALFKQYRDARKTMREAEKKALEQVKR